MEVREESSFITVIVELTYHLFIQRVNSLNGLYYRIWTRDSYIFKKILQKSATTDMTSLE